MAYHRCTGDGAEVLGGRTLRRLLILWHKDETTRAVGVTQQIPRAEVDKRTLICRLLYAINIAMVGARKDYYGYVSVRVRYFSRSLLRMGRMESGSSDCLGVSEPPLGHHSTMG